MVSSLSWAQTIDSYAVSSDSAQSARDGMQEDDPEPGRRDDGDVVVTGSRIRLPNVASQEPIVTVTSEYIEARNLTNVADALNELPGFRNSLTPNGTQGSFGQGVNFINTFGIGTNRTLTLVNGRRVVSSNPATNFSGASPGTQVDINIIPSILVDSVDRISIGGAPVYGSDAIAGTLNFNLRDRFNGLEALVTSGLTERGDNHRFNIQAIAGRDFAGGRGNVTIAGMYEEVDGLVMNDRDFYRNNLGNLQNPTSAEAARFGPAGRTPQNDGRINPGIGFNDSPTDGIPATVLVRNLTIPSLSRGGLIISPAGQQTLGALDYARQFDHSGNLVPFNPGVIYQGNPNAAFAPITGGAARAAGSTDGFRFSDFGQITSDIRRISANIFAHYDMTDEVTLFAEGTYYRGRGDQLLRQPTFNASLFGGASGAMNFSVNNPFLTDQARQQLVAAGYSTFRLSRVNLDLADQTGYNENDLFRVVAGASSDFELAGRSYNAEVSINYGNNYSRDHTQAINQQHFVNALNVTRNAAGQIVCTAAPALNAVPGFTPVADAACQPLNLFGEGVASRAALDYVVEDVVTRTRLEQIVINANFGGSPFDLFGNPVGFNAGFEHRQENARFTPSSFEQQGLGRSVAIVPLSGSYNLDEVFGEVLVPFIRPENNAFIDSAEVFARGRYVNNTVNGGFFSWAAGGSISPIADIRLRGNYTRSFRAPAITELFLPTVNTFTTVTDYCSPANRNAGPVPETRATNCAAFLATFPNATPLSAASATVPGQTGGNPNLLNEQANSYTFGGVLQPRFLPGFSLAIDYLNIKLRNPISSLTVAQIGSACFDNANFNTADPANGNAFCSQIRRDATGQVVSDPLNPGVTAGYVNGVRYDFDGIQAVLDYRTSLAGLKLPGTLSVGGDLFYVGTRINDVTGVAPARSDGIVGDPQFQGQVRLTYRNDTWGFGGFVNYVGEQMISRFDRGPSPNDTREFDEYDDFVTIDANVFANVTRRLRVNFSVTNLTNRIGQTYFGEYIPGAISDAFGRRFTVSARVRY